MERRKVLEILGMTTHIVSVLNATNNALIKWLRWVIKKTGVINAGKNVEKGNLCALLTGM